MPRKRALASVVAALGVAAMLAAPGCGDLAPSVPSPGAVGAEFHGCPPEGRGGDPALNRLKNRTGSGETVPSSVDKMLSLPWPKGVERRHMSQWSPQDRAQVEADNGLFVQLEGYLIDVKPQGPESANCGSTADVDFHVWMAASPSDGREKSVIIEVTPRVRAQHPELSLDAVEGLVSRRTKVRVTGWTMLDPEHPDQVGKTRGTIWEVHPVLKIETVQ